MSEVTPDPRTTPPLWLWGVAVLCFAGIGAVAVLVVRGDAGSSPRAGPAPPQRSALDIYGHPSVATPRPEDACGAVDANRPANLEFELPAGRVDFGAVRQDQDVDRGVKFRNAGKGPLCITRVETGCGCIQARLLGDKQRFEPGEEGELVVTLAPAGRVGEVNKTIRLTTNDYDSPMQALPVVADVSLGVTIEPRYLQFGNHPVGTPAEAVLHLRSPVTDAEWTIKEVVGSRLLPTGQRVAYTFQVRQEQDARFRRVTLLVQMPGLDQLGPFHDAIIVKTSHPERPEILIQGRLQIVQRILSQRQRITLGWVGAGTSRPPQRTYLLAGGPDVRFRVLSATVRGPHHEDENAGPTGFSASFGQDAKGWWVDVRYDGSVTRGGQLEAMLAIATDDSEQPEVLIPISATVQER